MTDVSLENALTGRLEGWPLAPVLIWLLTEGRQIPRPGPLITALAEQLAQVGAPAWRLRTALRLIHPQMFGISVVWQRGRGPAEETRTRHGVFQSDAYIGSPIQAFNESLKTVRYRLDQLDKARDHLVLFELADQGATDYVIQPMPFSDGGRHFLAVATDRAEGFSDLDIAKFGLLAEALAPNFEIISRRHLSETLMDTYLGHRTGQKVLDGLIQRGDGEAIDAALWYSDLRDFTALTDALPPEQLFDLLNAYFEFLSSAVTARGGEVLSFIGDAMLVMFPCGEAAPGSVTGNVPGNVPGNARENARENAQGNAGGNTRGTAGGGAVGTAGENAAADAGANANPNGAGRTGGISGGNVGAQDACQAAIDSAIDAFDSLATVNFSRRRNGQPEIRFGLGLDVGKVIYGNVGAPDRLAFTVIGPTVNRTARLESLTKTTGQPVLMSDSFAQKVSQAVTFVGHFEMKGIPEPQPVYALKNAP